MDQEVHNRGTGAPVPTAEHGSTRRAIIVWTFTLPYEKKSRNGRITTHSSGTRWRFLTQLGPSSQYHQNHLYEPGPPDVPREALVSPTDQPQPPQDIMLPAGVNRIQTTVSTTGSPSQDCCAGDSPDDSPDVSHSASPLPDSDMYDEGSPYPNGMLYPIITGHEGPIALGYHAGFLHNASPLYRMDPSYVTCPPNRPNATGTLVTPGLPSNHSAWNYPQIGSSHSNAIYPRPAIHQAYLDPMVSQRTHIYPSGMMAYYGLHPAFDGYSRYPAYMVAGDDHRAGSQSGENRGGESRESSNGIWYDGCSVTKESCLEDGEQLCP